MLCTFIDGPENGQREEIADDCAVTYCTGLSREYVDWYERDTADPSRFVYRGKLTMAKYLDRTKEERRIREILRGFEIAPEMLPEWAR